MYGNASTNVIALFFYHFSLNYPSRTNDIILANIDLADHVISESIRRWLYPLKDGFIQCHICCNRYHTNPNGRHQPMAPIDFNVTNQLIKRLFKLIPRPCSLWMTKSSVKYASGSSIRKKRSPAKHAVTSNFLDNDMSSGNPNNAIMQGVSRKK